MADRPIAADSYPQKSVIGRLQRTPERCNLRRSGFVRKGQ